MEDAPIPPGDLSQVQLEDADQSADETQPSTLPRPGRGRKAKPRIDRVEAYFSRLSAKNNFFHRLFSMIWLPYAFRSGIKMKRLDASTFTAVLPFKRFNRNWYNAMAGASLLANSEIAGGMYVFGMTGGGYSVVCKELTYRFLRPCLGPAVYRVNPQEDIKALIATGEAFNIRLDLDILQQIHARPGKERRVGKCLVEFHATPQSLMKTGRASGKAGKMK